MSNIVSVEVNKTLGTIQDNLDAVEASIRQKVAEYRGYVVTEDNIKDSKQMLADIRKDQKALDDDRKKIKSEWNKPFDDFEVRAKKIIALYDEPIKVINGQLSAFEEDRKNAKRATISNIYNEVDKGEFADWIPLDSIFNNRWLNATYSEKDICAEIEAEFESLKISVSSIKTMESEFEQEGLETLKKTGDFQRAVQEMTKRTKMKEEIIRKEQEKAEAYAREKAENEARARAEEEARVKAEEEAKAKKQAAESLPFGAVPFPDIPPMEEETFIPPKVDDGPFEKAKTVTVSVYLDESELNKFKMLMDFNGYRYEVR